MLAAIDPMQNDDAFRAAVLNKLSDIDRRLTIIETEFKQIPSKVADHDRYVQQQTGGAKTLNWLIGPVSGIVGAIVSWFLAKQQHP
jgi:hypothetical protein